MADQPSSLDRSSVRLARAMALLDDVSGNVRAAGQLLALLGWDLPPGIADIGLTRLDVSTLVRRLDELAAVRGAPDSSDLEIAAAVGEVVVALAETLQGIEDVVAGLSATGDYFDRTNIEDELFTRVADVLVIQTLGATSPIAIPLGVLLGFLELRHLPADPAIFQVEHVRQIVHWDRLGALVTDPENVMRDVYGWGTPAFDSARLITNLAGVLDHLAGEVRVRQVPRRVEEQLAGRPVPEADTDPAVQLLVSIVRELGFDGLDVGLALQPLRPSTAGGSDGGLVLAPFAFGTTETSFPVSDQTSVVLTTEADLEGGIALQLRAGQDPSVVTGLIAPGPGGTDPPAAFSLGLRHAGAAGGRQVLFSLPAVIFDAAAVSAGLGVTVSDVVDPSFALAIEDGRLVIAADRSDGFLAKILPEGGVTAALSLEVSWSRRDGLRIRGGAGLTTTIGLHTSIGPLRIDTLDMSLQGAPDGLALRTTLSGAAVFGPFVVVLEGVGVAALLRFERGNLGPVDLGAELIPPTGIGLSIEAGPVKGGGVIVYDPVKHRYAGELAVEIGDIGVTGLVLVDTVLPGGRDGFALLVSLRATFPAIQVGFGFALTGVGGLLALNRRIDVDALRQRLASGTAGGILAPEDPIRNASSLLADLDSVFPIAPGVTVVGPTVQLVWAGLVRFDIGVFIELPGPTRIVLLGSARASIDQPGGGKPYLTIRVDIIGEIDLQRRTAAFDAVLVDSQLLEIFDLTGGAAFRLSWGDQPYAVLTLGGFHPAYNPEPLVFPSSLQKIAMVHGSADDSLFLRLEGYFAVTTNTLQLGAAIQAVIKSGSFNIQGIVAFDALIVFQPFHFQLDIRASVRVRYKSRNLAGLTLTGSLAGPGPVVLRAKVCIELLFFDICFSDTFTLGSSSPPAATTIGSALDELLQELDRPENLQSGGTNDPHVVLRPPPEGAGPVVVPALGQLVWVQRRAPIGLLLQRIGGAPLTSPASIEATSPAVDSPELDWFAPGSFEDLSDDEVLNRKPFERLGAGLRLGQAGTEDGPSAAKTVTVKQIRLPARATVTLPGTFFPAWLMEATAVRNGKPPEVTPVPAMVVSEEAWTVSDLTGAATATGLSQAQAHQLAKLGAEGQGVATATIDRFPVMSF